MNDPAELSPAELRELAACDAACVVLMRAVQRRGRFAEVWAEMSEADQADYLAAEERHAARMRAAGRPGW